MNNINFEEDQKEAITQTNDVKALSDQVLNLRNLEDRIKEKEAELISAISQQGKDHPVVESLQKKLIKLKDSLESETRTLISHSIYVYLASI